MPAAAVEGVAGASPRPRRDRETWRVKVSKGGSRWSPLLLGSPGQNTVGGGQDFQTPVPKHQRAGTPAPRPREPPVSPVRASPAAREPRRALCGKAPGWRGASPLQGPGARGGARAEERRRGGGSGGSRGRAPGRLTAAAAGEAAAALARGPGGAAGLQRRRGCGGRDCGGRHLGALPAPAPRAARALA